MKKNLHGIQGVGFSYIVPKSQLKRHVQNIRNENKLDTIIGRYNIKPIIEREIYTSIIYLEPFDFRNRRAFGYDMFSEPVRRKAMEQSRDYDLASLTGKVLLLQETDENLQAGTLMYVPVYRKNKPTKTVEERRSAIFGWVYSPYRMGDLMKGILGRWDTINEARIHLKIYDNANLIEKSLLFDSNIKQTSEQAKQKNRNVIESIVFNKKIWTLHFKQSNSLISLFSYKVLIVLISGVIISFLIFSLTLSLLNTKLREQIFKNLSSDLINANKELAFQNEEKEKLVAELRLSNEERQKAKERYESFISQISEGVYRFELDEPMPINLPVEAQIDFMYNHAFIAECNNAFMKMYGIKEPKDVIGKSQLEIHGGSTNLKNREAIRLFIESGYHSENNETEEPDENGEIRYYLNSSIGIVKDEHLIRQWGTQRDVTTLKKSEEALIKLSSAVEQSPASIIITDLEGKIEYVNQKFVEVTGYSVEEALGNNPRILNSGEKPKEEYQKMWETIKSGESWTGEFHNKRKNGELYWESASISPIVDKYGNKKYFLAVNEDITAKKEMINDLVIAKERAEQSDRLKSAFIANMSHEIRTPMNGILGFTELLKSDDLNSDKRQKYIKIIEKSGARLLTTIDDIMNISKIESGLMKISLSEININNEIEELYEFFKFETENKGLQLLVVNSIPEDESIVKTDEEKLHSILVNLIKNAIKFTKQGSVEFGCSKRGNQLEFYVKDTGIGIPLDRQPYVFDRFVQADIEDKAVYEGSGLGLAISKSYVEMLGGGIELESVEGISSTFRFTIPCQAINKEIQIAKNESSIDFVVSETPALKVLIVEDDMIAQLYLEEALTAVSKEILLADNGYTALDLCRENSDIDLILMDIRMSGINGYEVTKQIRQFNKEVIIIAQTAFALSGDREKALEAGCNEYISKPINKDYLVALIQKYFKK